MCSDTFVGAGLNSAGGCKLVVWTRLTPGDNEALVHQHLVRHARYCCRPLRNPA